MAVSIVAAVVVVVVVATVAPFCSVEVAALAFSVAFLSAEKMHFRIHF